MGDRVNSLYRWHVLEDRTLPDPGRPPYFTAGFFNTIQDIHLNTPLNVAWISVKQWYQLLLERGATHTSEDQDSPPLIIPSKFEESNPGTDWDLTYRLSRQFGLTPEEKTFAFKKIQNLFPNREGPQRTGKAPSPLCIFCEDQLDTTANLILQLRSCLSIQVDNLSLRDVISLNLQTSESWQLPAVWLVCRA